MRDDTKNGCVADYPDRRVPSVFEVSRVTHARALMCSRAVPDFQADCFFKMMRCNVFPVLCRTLIYFLVRDLNFMQVYWFVLVFAKLACHKKAMYRAVCTRAGFLTLKNTA